MREGMKLRSIAMTSTGLES